MDTRNLAVGVGLGMALAFIFDPSRGRRRRALARDKMVRATRKTRDALDATARDIANRTKGIAASTFGRSERDGVEDDVLVERVRASLGRVCSHPRAIDVVAANGEVTLRGPILAREVEDVLATVRAVKGVLLVRNEVEPHETGEGIPSLQGRGNVPGSRLDIMQRNWAPATQALVAAAGLAATGVCMAAYSRRHAAPEMA